MNAAVVQIDTKTLFKLVPGNKVFADSGGIIRNIAPEIEGLQAVNLSETKQVSEGTSISFSNAKPVKVLVGYFLNKSAQYLQEPQLETDASANDYGQADIKIANAVQIEGMPPVNIHTFTFKAGANTLTLGRGACLILGFIDDGAYIPVYDAGLSNSGNIKDLRWLFN